MRACRRRCARLAVSLVPLLSLSDESLTRALVARQQNFELNPKHPLIERLLEKVEEAGDDEEALDELKESVTVLWYVLPLALVIS